MKRVALIRKGKRKAELFLDNCRYEMQGGLGFPPVEKLIQIDGNQPFIEIDGKRFKDGQPRRYDFEPQDFHIWDDENPKISDWALTDWKEPYVYPYGSRVGQPNGIATVIRHKDFAIVDRSYSAVCIDGMPFETSHTDEILFENGEWNRYDVCYRDSVGFEWVETSLFFFRSPIDFPKELIGSKEYIIRRGLYFNAFHKNGKEFGYVSDWRINQEFTQNLERILHYRVEMQKKAFDVWKV